MEAVGLPVSAAEAGNNLIKDVILQCTPAAVNRIGLVELDAYNKWRERPVSRGDVSSVREFQLLHRNAGIYPLSETAIANFVSEYRAAMDATTHLAIIRNWGEGRFVRTLEGKKVLFRARGVDPFYWSRPWTGALAGKRVLVVTPFASSVVSQYEKREKIWPANPELLPAFSLSVVRAPLSGGIAPPEHRDWNESLTILKEQVREHSFDVLIAGAGAFAPPLAALARSMGRIGINLGGSTQVLFGIRGARWDRHPYISKFFNESWVRPSSAETPQDAHQVEGACYW